MKEKKELREIIDGTEIKARRVKNYLEVTFPVNEVSPFLQKFDMKLYSTERQREIERSPKSNMYEWKWYLSDGEYIVSEIMVDKFGKHYCEVYEIFVDVEKEDVSRLDLEIEEVPRYVKVCEECRERKVQKEAEEEGKIKETPTGNRYKGKVVDLGGSKIKIKLYEVRLKTVKDKLFSRTYVLLSKKRGKEIEPHEEGAGEVVWYLAPGEYKLIKNERNMGRKMNYDKTTIYDLIIKLDGNYYLKETD